MTQSVDPGVAASDAVGAGEAAPAPTLRGLADGVAATLLQGSAIARAGTTLGAELTKIGLGRSEVAPARGDWRFKDPSWQDNPIYRRIAQAYLASCAAADTVLEEVDRTADSHRAARARFAVDIATSALAPTNFLLGNPGALKRTFETGGANLVRGLGNWASDVRHNGGMPSMTKEGVLKIGEDLALTPGAVVLKNEQSEVIQYAPTTELVYERPVLVVPPPIGRYYFLDLRPGRSFVEYAVSRGLQTFMISWRNPSANEADWDIDAYAERVAEAVAAVQEITGAPDVNVIGFCAGGIIQSMVLNKLAATGEEPIHSASFAVTLLDFGQSAPINAFSSAKLLDFARRRAGRAGVTSARAMGSAFTWMRPNDLVWNYWVNNYLMGEDPPVFDILAWNADGTNLPARLHQQFLDIFQTNPIPKAGAMESLGVPVDLASIKVPTFVVGAINDHLTPWKSTYRTTQLLSGDTTFVLSNAGHIASLVNPPGNPKASYYTGPHDRAEGPEEWLETATKQTGSWWEHWADWAIEHSGEEVPAPESLGSAEYPVLGEAPGTYVRQPN
ncbi:PHA/PHB synthase family protein [Nocardioides sp. GXZ039]|uniref:PHA/PHB synthase family protein n=1 Tax=Nocardioides sp. GXZ039 TaxID=3136018 RepID=UPI0030F3BF9D